MTTSGRARTDASLRSRAEDVGRLLQHAIGELLAELARRGTHDQRSIQAAFELSQSATSRLLASVRSGDPLATLSLIPGPEALEQMRQGALRMKVEQALLTPVEDAIRALRSFLDSDVGNRGTLDAVLVDWVQESRASFELRHKAAIYKSFSALRGVQARTVLSSVIVHPSDRPAVHDAIGIDAVIGCRRVRPNGVLRLSSTHLAMPKGAPLPVSTLDGGPIDTMLDQVLPAFSSMPAEHIESWRHGNSLQLSVAELPLGQGPTRGEDLVLAQVFRGSPRARRGQGGPRAGFGGQAEPATEFYVLDALLHDDVWPDVKPELEVFDTVVRGIAHVDDKARQGDKLDILESVQALGRGPASFRLAEFARYPELIEHACARMGWDPARLRGFRCRVRYPVYGSQIAMAFKLPQD